jgi:23S rRNA pseudouridine1911/1915/1917 synthase
MLIGAGEVSLNGAVCHAASRKLRAGDRVEAVLPEAADAEPAAEAIPLHILYEDSEIVVLDKPAGMVAHPAPGNWSGTLVNALLHHCGDSLQGIGGVKRPGIVHRLDKDTSGVMVVAKTQQAHNSLSGQFADRDPEGALARSYLAIAWERLPKRSGTIDAPLGRSRQHRTRRAVVPAGASDARRAVTHYTALAYLDGSGSREADATYVSCRLETGRTHQIRVHMSHIGHPLIGDREYSRHFQTKVERLIEPARSRAAKFGRQALHAAQLRFCHPSTGETMDFRVEPPEDFLGLLAAFEKVP